MLSLQQTILEHQHETNPAVLITTREDHEQYVAWLMELVALRAQVQEMQGLLGKLRSENDTLRDLNLDNRRLYSEQQHRAIELQNEVLVLQRELERRPSAHTQLLDLGGEVSPLDELELSAAIQEHMTVPETMSDPFFLRISRARSDLYGRWFTELSERRRATPEALQAENKKLRVELDYKNTLFAEQSREIQQLRAGREPYTVVPGYTHGTFTFDLRGVTEPPRACTIDDKTKEGA